MPLTLLPPRLAPPQHIITDVTRQVGTLRWQFVTFRASEEDLTDNIRVFLNGRRVLSKITEGHFGAVALRWPFPGQLLAVSEHSCAGHGMRTRLYRADRHGLKDLGVELVGEIGGPVLRDVDGDGRPEILFDDWDWYRHFDGPCPSRYDAYDFDGKRLRLWRRLAAPDHRRLPHRLPLL